MEVLLGFLTRIAMIIGLLYITTASVAFLGLLAVSWRKARWAERVHVIECPLCGGMAFDHDGQVCSLCDGESAMVVPVGSLEE